MNKLDKQYTDLLQDILDNGVEKSDRTGTGTKSVFGRQIRHKMSEGFPLLTTKKIPLRIVIVELLWFLRGDTNIKYLVDNGCNIWNGDCYKYFKSTFSQMVGIQSSLPTEAEFIEKIKTDDNFAEKWGDLGPIYGKQWRNWEYGETKSFKTDETYSSGEFKYDFKKESIDQIQNAINLLITDPDSRRNIVSAWNVGELSEMVLPPCHNFFQFYTRELTFMERCLLAEKAGWMTPLGMFDYPETHWMLDHNKIPKRAISLMWNQRSVDTFLGLPFNIASYGLLLEIIAKEVNMVPDELIGNLGDTHLYLNHIEQAKEQIGVDLSLEERIVLKPDYLDIINLNDIKCLLGVESEWVLEQAKDDDEITNWAPRKIILDTLGVPKRTREPFVLPTLSINDEFWNPDRTPESFDWTIKGMEIFDFGLIGYNSHPTIKAPLSN